MAKLWEYANLEKTMLTRALPNGGVAFRPVGPDIDPADIAEMPIAQQRRDVRELIKDEKRRRQRGGVLVGTDWFDTDPTDRAIYAMLATVGAGIPAGYRLDTMDDRSVVVDQVLVTSIITAITSHDKACNIAARDHKQAVNAAADPSAYDWRTGWPVIYGE